MGFNLSRDILYIVLDCLRDDKDYNSIYQSAVSSKIFTRQALGILYQLYDTSPVKGGGSEDEQFRLRRAGVPYHIARNEEDSVIRKWALMWRSIILSALDKTYLPYYSYIRYLDLDDLGYLLGEARFTGGLREFVVLLSHCINRLRYLSDLGSEFFSPELHDFLSRDYETKGNKRLRSSRVFPDSSWVSLKCGSAIVEKTTSIRGLSCNIPPSSLSEWIERLPLLQALTIWSGDALTQHAGAKIRRHCPDFKRLTVYTWRDEPPRDAEADCEEFLNDLRPHTLEYFETISYSHLGPRSIKALGSQLNSLVELKLTSLKIEAIAELPSLTLPPALSDLVLTDSMPAARTTEFYSIVTRVADWISSCKALRRLELRRFVDDSALLSQALTDEGPHLTTLSVSGYRMAGSRAFHEALASQQKLQNLYLRGEGSDNPDENIALVQSIGQLNDLRELELKDVSDGFFPDHVMSMTPFLPNLERLWISGDYFDDGIWNAFLCLPKLQSLAIHALSEFTVQGILNFITQLRPGNKGFVLSILNATTEGNLAEEEQAVINDTLRHNLDGSFDFGLAHEEYSDVEYEDLSD